MIKTRHWKFSKQNTPLTKNVSITFRFLAEEKKTLAQDKAKEIEEQNKVIAVEKKEAESSLAEALPALEAARIALQDLEKSDVTEIRYIGLFSFCCWIS